MTISYSNGRLTFSSFDGRAPFERGRFFFDNAEGIVGDRNALYTLVPNRCVLRRNPANLSEITGAWSLPLNLPSGIRYSLERAPGGVWVWLLWDD